MKTTKMMIMVLFPILIGMMYQFASAQNCPGRKVLMAQGSKGHGCGSCKQQCVLSSEVQTYLTNGWYYGECFRCNNNYVRLGEEEIVTETMLTEIYPNPASGSVAISFNLSQESEVTLQVFDMTGRYVATVVNELFEKESNELTWDASGLSPGIYFLKMKAGSYSETKRISVIN